MMSVKAWSVGNAAKSKEKQNSKSIRQQQEVQQKKRNIGRNHITRKWRQLKKNRLQTHTDTDTQTDRHTHTDSTHTHTGTATGHVSGYAERSSTFWYSTSFWDRTLALPSLSCCASSVWN